MMKDKLSAAYLAKHGVARVLYTETTLRCKECRQQWSPNLGLGGKLPRGFWKCPNGCNTGK